MAIVSLPKWREEQDSLDGSGGPILSGPRCVQELVNLDFTVGILASIWKKTV